MKYILGIFLFLNFTVSAQRVITNFNKDWQFLLNNDSSVKQIPLNDSGWRRLDLPHDWSIEGTFSESNPATTQGGALPGGIGWYKKIFSLPAASKGKMFFIEFDGVYRNSEVWINGNYLGRRPNGYISFRYDLTNYLKYDEPNEIAVRVDNSKQPNSRWYSGSGIYRNVRLVSVNKIAVDQWGTYVRASVFDRTGTLINIKTKIVNNSGMDQTILLHTEIFDPAGKMIYSDTNSKHKKFRITGTDAEHSLAVNLNKPQLWSVDKPSLYKAVIKIIKNGKLLDAYETVFGIRYFNFDVEKGFSLNGKPMKILGVCMHHDLGALGTAVNVSAIRRQLKLLKEMGCNAIRTSHNPPAPELLELCDQMGFIVMDEAFDMWKKKKNKYDYYSDFPEWHQRDLEDQIKRDRNHPCVFIWSIGNEIREQFDSSGISIAKELVNIIKNLDTTRPVTAALSEPDPNKNFIYQSKALDLVGLNYHQELYADFPKNYPGQKMIATENMSALASRGRYDMPSDSVRYWPDAKQKTMENVNGDYSVSAYDNVAAYWGSTHEATWKIIKKYDFISGLFVWTGFDYLGEPTPYPWPARSSYFGIIDLAGFPKDVYYMYQSEWTKKPVLHLFPHWNWEQEADGAAKTIDVWSYYNNADEVELFLNGNSLGKRKKENDQLHVMWQVPYTAGILKAVSRKNGKIILVKELKTAAEPAVVKMTADRNIIHPDGQDLSFITVKILDKAGNMVPNADNLLHFFVTGNGSIAGVDNGFEASTESFRNQYCKAYKGMCLVIIRPGTRSGKIKLTATAEGLPPTSIELKLQ
ncbi:MAG: beta-galactosidase GalB [Ferruginibacter sp.]